MRPRQVVVLKTHVLMTRTYANSVVRTTTGLQAQLVRTRNMLRRSEDERMEIHTLLMRALHELAVERKLRDPQHFVRKWVSEHRAKPSWIRSGDEGESE